MGYGLVLFWRWLFLAIQLAAVAGFAWIYWVRSSPEPRAGSDLAAGHAITAADLRLPLTDPLVGKHLRRDVKAGEAITPDLLTSSAPRKLPDASLAAVVALAASEARKMGLGRGTRVDVVRGGSAAPIRGTVMETSCDDKKCLVYVGLDKAPPGQVIDTATFAAATLVVATAP
ncbi:SAF domain-containing protein [Variovorax saccharolyticus]|uniref:SAF domain-containing protein n=1 Tax=Variovorax saccharolyticus TaxID=3053516 RepID=UPI0025773D3A|nr:SAF domain-containing protein [Variovorax sp. J31P216]MDM0026281.1 SAF domain-containing protein [Variovorax sp. J31P216]